VVLACPEESVLAKTARLAGVNVISAAFPDVRLAAPARPISAVVALRRLIRSVKPETLVGNSARCQVYAVVATADLHNRPPVVCLMHEHDSAQRALLRSFYRRARRLDAVGAGAARTYRDWLPGVDIHQVNNFLDDDELERLGSLRKPDAGAPGSTVIGVLGRMLPEKGILELVDELAAVGPDAWGELRIAAFPQRPEYERRVRERISELGLEQRIALLGPVSDTAAFLEKADLLIVPSTGNEGQPTVILEALAAGRAVIVRSQLYTEDYEGLAVRAYENVDDLREAILSPPDATASHEVLRERFGAKQVVAALERW
jgi:glycosyltransferase involved in cell wall biosynthesis